MLRTLNSMSRGMTPTFGSRPLTNTISGEHSGACNYEPCSLQYHLIRTSSKMSIRENTAHGPGACTPAELAAPSSLMLVEQLFSGES
jgi:hypothetical protein